MTARGNSKDHLVIDEYDEPIIRDVYTLLVMELGFGRVEDFDNFLCTVSKDTDNSITPHVVGLMRSGKFVGVVVGAYIKTVNVGILLYSAVHSSERRQGIYSNLRSRLLRELNVDSTRNQQDGNEPRLIDYLISEVEKDSWLLHKYAKDWGAFVADCDYIQPNVQGLDSRPMNLVLQPFNVSVPPSQRLLGIIVNEIYKHVYRITDFHLNTRVNHVVQSFHVSDTKPKPTSPLV